MVFVKESLKKNTIIQPINPKGRPAGATVKTSTRRIYREGAGGHPAIIAPITAHSGQPAHLKGQQGDRTAQSSVNAMLTRQCKRKASRKENA